MGKLMDKKFFEQMKEIYAFKQEIYNSLKPIDKTKYLYNYFQWKQIEATENGDENSAKGYYQTKKEIQNWSDPQYIKNLFKIKKLPDKLYDKCINQLLKKINIELDFI